MKKPITKNSTKFRSMNSIGVKAPEVKNFSTTSARLSRTISTPKTADLGEDRHASADRNGVVADLDRPSQRSVFREHYRQQGTGGPDRKPDEQDNRNILQAHLHPVGQIQDLDLDAAVVLVDGKDAQEHEPDHDDDAEFLDPGNPERAVQHEAVDDVQKKQRNDRNDRRHEDELPDPFTQASRESLHVACPAGSRRPSK